MKLEEIKALCEAATPGPWSTSRGIPPYEQPVDFLVVTDSPESELGVVVNSELSTPEDLAFIAAFGWSSWGRASFTRRGVTCE